MSFAKKLAPAFFNEGQASSEKMCSENGDCKFHDKYCDCGLQSKSNKLSFQPIKNEEQKERKKGMKDVFYMPRKKACKCNKKCKGKKTK